MEKQKISTGLVDLDRILGGGLSPSSIVFVGARPAMGKTSLLITLSSIMINRGEPSFYVSLEQNEENVCKKMLANLADIELYKSIDELNGHEYQRLIASKNQMEKYGGAISCNRDFSSLCEELRKISETMKVVFIDYLQLIPGSQGYEGCSHIVTTLKNLAMETGLCIVIATQLSRKVEERAGHRPFITDLRDCGTIEEVADAILLILRREYYDPMDKPGMAEIIVAKNRLGDKGSVNTIFRKEICQFANYTKIDYSKSYAKKEEESFI